jgi:hypothetical protein
MKRPTTPKETSVIIYTGLADALAEIHRQAEARLCEVMQPARFRPLNYTHRNGRAASNAIIEGIRS